jgi:hypothetical protein
VHDFCVPQVTIGSAVVELLYNPGLLGSRGVFFGARGDRDEMAREW